MIYYANMQLPKTPEVATNGKYYTQDVINKLVKSINETTGYHVVEVKNSETHDILRIEIDTEKCDGIIVDSLGGVV